VNEANAKAFDFAQETAKQVLTLATAVLALTITFIKEIENGKRLGHALVTMEAGWILFLISIVFGVMTLMTLSGNLERPQSDSPSIYGGNITAMAGAQMIAFFLALGCTIAFGFMVG
jgi:hypothetical protein